MRRPANYVKFRTQYITIDLIVGLLVFGILSFTFITENNIELSKRLFRDFRRNWESPLISDIISVNQSAECPQNYENFFNETLEPVSDGCYYQTHDNKTVILKGECSETSKLKSFFWIRNITAKKLKVYRKTKICIKRMGSKRINDNFVYLNYLNSTVSSNEQCSKGKKSCGYIDTSNNILCLNESENCPINSIIIPDSKDDLNKTLNYTEIKLGDSSSLFFTNQNTSSQVINEIRLGENQICIDPQEKDYSNEVYPLFENEENYKCKVQIQGFKFDTRFKEIDSYSYSRFLIQNHVPKILLLPDFVSSYLNTSSQISLRSRPYISWNKACTSNIEPTQVTTMFKQMRDISDLRNEFFYYHLIVVASFIIINIIVKWRLIKERIELFYIVLLEFIFSFVCLIELLIALSGAYKLYNFTENCDSIGKSGCLDNLESLIVQHVGGYYHNLFISYIFISAAALFCFIIYPASSCYIYRKSFKSSDNQKEMNNLVENN